MKTIFYAGMATLLLLFPNSVMADTNTESISQHGLGLNTFAEKLDREGNLVAIATRHQGATLIDVSNPQSPITLATVQPDPSTQDIWDVDIHGNYLYLMNRPEGVDSNLNNWVGLYIYDISNPVSPVLTGTILWGSAAWHHLAGSVSAGTVGEINGVPHAFLCSDITGAVEVFDLSTPSAPVFVSSIFPTDIFASAAEAVFQNNRVYIAWGRGGFSVEDVSVPATPLKIIDQVFTGPPTINGGLWSIQPTPDGTHVVTGEYTLEGKVRIWDVQSSSAIETANWELNSGALLWTVRATNDFAFVAHLEDGIQILDIRNRNQIGRVGDFDLDTAPPQTQWSGVSDVVIDGNRIYACHDTAGLLIVDFGDSINITKAEWRARKNQLTVFAKSSDQPDRSLTVQGYGSMTWNSRKKRYELKLRGVTSNPGSITVYSDLVGEATSPVTRR